MFDPSHPSPLWSVRRWNGSNWSPTGPVGDSQNVEAKSLSNNQLTPLDKGYCTNYY